MKNLYQRTFDKVSMPEDAYLHLRTVLASRCSHKETEVNKMKNRSYFKKGIVMALAVLMVAALSITAFAYGGQIFSFLTGGTVEQGTDENGVGYTSVSMSDSSPVKEFADGIVMLDFNGELTDISGLFSLTEPYIHDCVAEDGLRHVIVVGGEAGAIGWAEFMWDAEGMPMAGSASFGTAAGREDAPWHDAAMEILGLPW